MKETILLVDDEQGIRTVMGLSLRDAGYNVITVASGEEALQLFAERPIPIVITDIRMPGMNGLDLLKHIKILAPETEVILISGHADLEMAIQGLKLEASDFITKPIDDDLLHISLKRALERIAMRNKLKEYTSNLEKMINEKSAQLVEAERQLAARQVVDGFAFGLHTLGSSMSGEQQAFNELPCFIAMHDRFMEVLAVNDLYRERLGNLVGHPSWEPYVLHSNEAMFPVERAIVEGRGARSEQILRDKNGKEIPVLVHTAPILNNEGEVELVLELSVDEQESRRLREELRVTRERFRQLFEESPCYVSVVGRDLQVLEANRAFRHTFGMQSGKRCYELFAGSSAPCDECPVQRSFQDGKPCHTEKVVIDHEGRPVNVLVWTAPLRDTSGNITECIEMATDITELRQLQDRLASLGLLMGSTAHGIKGMLTALDGSVYRLGSGIDKGDEARTRDSLKDMRQLVARLRKMVLDILYFAKERKLDWNILVAEEFMRSVVSTVSDKAAEAGIAMTLEADGDPGTFEADASALSAALVNLLENAVDACRADGSKKEHYVRVSVKGLPDAVEVRIEDNGIGMTEETRTKLFTLFFSSKGKMYRLKAYEIPEAGRQAKGTAIVNLLQLDSDEKITAAITLRQFEEGKYLFFGTKHGVVKKSDLLMYNTARKGGLAAIVLDEDDELINVRLSDGNDDIILSTFGGMCIRFNEADVRPMGRVSRGVRGIKLSDGDYVVGMSAASEGDDLLVVTENGFGKKTPLTEYKTQTRGGKGVTTYRISDATGNIAGITVVSESDDIMLITSEGVVIRMKTREISRIGRLTKGVRLMRLDDNVSVVSIARTDEEEDEETETVSPEETVGEYVPDEADNEEETAEEPDTEE